MTAPLLLTIIVGIVGTGNILTQLPWSAHTAYQLASTLAETTTEIGEIAVHSRLDQLMAQRQSMFGRLGFFETSAEQLFPGSYYGNINGVEVVGVRFQTSIAGLLNIHLPRALSMEITAPHLAASINVASITGFANPTNTYDCCGILCNGGNCSGTIVCYDAGGAWIGGSCPTPGT